MIDRADLVEFAIEHAQNQGSSFAEARLIESEEETYVTLNGMFVSVQKKPNFGLGLRVIADGGVAFVSTGVLNKDEVETRVETAVKMAKLGNRRDPIVLSEEEQIETQWKTPVERPFEDVTDEEKRKYIKNVDKRLKKEVKGKLSRRVLVFMLNTEKKYFINSEGTKIYSENSLPAVYTMITAKGKQGSEQRMFGQGGSGGWEWFKKTHYAENLVDDSQSLVNAANSAENHVFDSEIDVIISGEVAGIMSHENVGHPSEADRIMGREGAQAGESFYVDLLKNGELGEVILGSENVNIIDDPTLPMSAGYYEYDDEGVKAFPRYLVKDGKLNTLLLNREFAAKMNTHSNAAARAISFEREPITRMANTYFKPGDFQDVEELAEDIKSGIYMCSFTEWNIDDRRFQSKYVGLEAYIIENGELTEKMVRRPVLELTTFGILGSVDAVTRNMHMDYGTCGKSDPMQGVPVNMGGAEVRLRDIKVGGGL